MYTSLHILSQSTIISIIEIVSHRELRNACAFILLTIVHFILYVNLNSTCI